MLKRPLLDQMSILILKWPLLRIPTLLCEMPAEHRNEVLWWTAVLSSSTMHAPMARRVLYRSVWWCNHEVNMLVLLLVGWWGLGLDIGFELLVVGLSELFCWIARSLAGYSVFISASYSAMTVLNMRVGEGLKPRWSLSFTSSVMSM